jgi:shikimate dehydrogenase
MKITGRTAVYLIAADPITQVRAPEVFNAIFAKAGIDAIVVPIQLPAHGLGDFISGCLSGEGVKGILLSIPHKTAATQYVHVMDRFSQAAGAVNAIRRVEDGQIEGALFDGEGFVKALDYFGISLQNQKILIAGAGGAGSAIGASLANKSPSSITFYDPVEGRANATAARIRQIFPNNGAILGSTAPQLEEFTLVINATPLGLHPEDPLPFDVTRIDREAKVVDILMNKTETPLLRACAKRHLCAFPGYEMLVQQVPNYLDFFGYKDLSIKVSEDLPSIRSVMN